MPRRVLNGAKFNYNENHATKSDLFYFSPTRFAHCLYGYCLLLFHSVRAFNIGCYETKQNEAGVSDKIQFDRFSSTKFLSSLINTRNINNSENMRPDQKKDAESVDLVSSFVIYEKGMERRFSGSVCK